MCHIYHVNTQQDDKACYELTLEFARTSSSIEVSLGYDNLGQTREFHAGLKVEEDNLDWWGHGDMEITPLNADEWGQSMCNQVPYEMQGSISVHACLMLC